MAPRAERSPARWKEGIDPGATGIKIFIKNYSGLDGLGVRVYGKREEMVFLGREISEQRDYGEKIADEIDDAVKRLIEYAYNAAKDILINNKEKLVQIARYLIKNETVDGEALGKLFNSDPPPIKGDITQIAQGTTA